jgi:hypothetical protein
MPKKFTYTADSLREILLPGSRHPGTNMHFIIFLSIIASIHSSPVYTPPSDQTAIEDISQASSNTCPEQVTVTVTEACPPTDPVVF